MKLVFCQATWRGDFELTLECIERMAPHVDHCIIVYDQTVTSEQVSKMVSVGAKSGGEVIPVYHEFKDNLPDMRNAYLEEAFKLSADWVCVSDPDELYSEALAKNLRVLIEEHEKLGFNLLPVHAHDQFDNVEWLDDLDLLKECPGGYRDTDFWKPMLVFKLYPSTAYQGVGLEKNVHESLMSSQNWRTKNLPKRFNYTHKKSALKIWRNAARNMFIGGGGDNVGRINPFWEPLRIICARFQVRNWTEFEEFIKGGKGLKDTEFVDWLKEALQAPPINWGTETRELAKWTYALNKDQVTDEIEELIKSPPEMTKEIEVENFVTRTYFEVMGRPPDEDGKSYYMDRILKDEMTRDQMILTLMQSEEFRTLQGGKAEEIEQVKVQVPVKVSVNLTEATFVEALMKSKTYWEKIRPKLDLGTSIYNALRGGKKKELMDWYYANKPNMGPVPIAKWIIENTPKPDSLALCIMGYRKVLPMILESIEVMAPYVDEIHIQGDDFTEEDTTAIVDTAMASPKKGMFVRVHKEPWSDNFSEYKNKAMAPANTEWVLVLDHDEIPTEDLAKNIRDIIKQSQHGEKYNKIQLLVIDEKVNKRGKVVERIENRSGKDCLLWNVDSPYYGNPHIWLKPHYYPWKTAMAPVAYRHVKEIGTELPRSVRNVFLGGGGDNTREGNPLWVKLQELSKELGLDTWARFNEYLKAGDADPRLLEVLVELSKMPWKDNELGDPLRYYQKLQKKLNKREGK